MRSGSALPPPFAPVARMPAGGLSARAQGKQPVRAVPAGPSAAASSSTPGSSPCPLNGPTTECLYLPGSGPAAGAVPHRSHLPRRKRARLATPDGEKDGDTPGGQALPARPIPPSAGPNPPESLLALCLANLPPPPASIAPGPTRDQPGLPALPAATRPTGRPGGGASLLALCLRDLPKPPTPDGPQPPPEPPLPIVSHSLPSLPIAVLAVDIETHGWITEKRPAETTSGWTGQFGKVAWSTFRQLQFARVVQLGMTACASDGRVLWTRSYHIRDAPPCQERAVQAHGLADDYLRANGSPATHVLAQFSEALCITDRSDGTLTSYALEFDAGVLLEEYKRLRWHSAAALLTRLARQGVCTYDMACSMLPPHPCRFLRLDWVCSRVGVDLPPVSAESRPHTAGYDSRVHASLYVRLRDMRARGASIDPRAPMRPAAAVTL